MSRHAIETPVRHLIRSLSEAQPNVAGAMRAARWLGVGALSGRNAEWSDRLHALGVEVPPLALTAPVPSIGTVHLLDSDGATHRAFRVALRRHDSSSHDAWLDARSIDAWRTAREAARRLLHDLEPPEPADALEAAEGEPDWTRRLAAPIAGRSIGLPLALAILSDWLGQPLRVDVAATGDLDARGNLLPIDLVAEKAVGLAIERPYVTELLAPVGVRIEPRAVPDGVRIVRVATLGEAATVAGLVLRGALRTPMRREDLVDAIRRFEHVAASRRVSASRMLERAESLWHAIGRFATDDATADSDEASLTLLARLIEYRTTAMLSDEAVALYPELDRVRRRRPWLEKTHSQALVRALNAYASALIDAPRLRDADRAAREALSLSAAGSPEHLRVRGTIARVLAHRRHDAEAVTALEEIVREQERELPRESNLPRCYLIGSLVRCGRFVAARGALQRGREVTRSLESDRGWGAANTLFLDYEEIRLLTAEGEAARAIALARQVLLRIDAEDGIAPWPKVGVSNRLVEALVALDRIDEAGEVLARCKRDVGAQRSRHMRWMLARAEATIAEWCLRHERSDAASRCLEVVRAACAELPTEADAPFAEAARRIAAGNASATTLQALRDGEIY